MADRLSLPICRGHPASNVIKVFTQVQRENVYGRSPGSQVIIILLAFPNFN